MPNQATWLLLPVETKVREFHAKLLLAAIAVERGYRVVLGEQNAMVRQIDYLPRGLYIDKSIASSKTEHFQRLRQRGNKVAAWCEEGLVYRNRQAYLEQRINLDSLAQVETFFCWGDVQRQDIGGLATGMEQKLSPTGNPRFDLLRPSFRGLFTMETQGLRKQFGDFILINTNFARYNHFYGEDSLLEFQRQRGTVENKEQEAYLLAWRDFLGEMYHAFVAMLAQLSSAFPDRQIILRPHPSENHQRWARECEDLDNVSVIFEGNVVPWLQAAKVLIHNSCTTGLESYFLDRSAIAYQPVKSEIYDSYLPNIVSRRVETIENLVKVVDDALAGQTVDGGLTGRDAAIEYYAATVGPLATERVLDAVDQIDLDMPQPTGPNQWLGRLSGHVKVPARDIVRKVWRPDAAAYGRQKFPGLGVDEIRRELAKLGAASGRFSTIRVTTLAHKCFGLAA